MTENVYVIKVKTKPPLSSLYPSERRYSASTVGGLSLVHLGLGALSLLLGALALSLQGPILSVACLVPSVTGLLAWRRWYIDRNITIFFYGSLFSLVAAVLCFVITIFSVAAVSTGGTAGAASLWPFQAAILLRPAQGINDTVDYGVIAALNVTASGDLPEPFAPRAIQPNASDNGDLEAEASMMSADEATNVTRQMDFAFWGGHPYDDSSHTRILLSLNILVAALLEAFWSLLSARIAFRGMTNCSPEDGGGSRAPIGWKATRLHKRKSPAPRPDILEHDRRLSESLQSLTGLQAVAAGPRLPLPESSREFRERVERFLANQPTHRIAEVV